MASVFLGLMLAVVNVAACEHTPGFTSVYLRAADKTLSFSDRREAYQKAIGACPDDAQLYDQLAVLLIGNRDFRDALLWLDKGLKISPASTELRVRKASGLIPLGLAREALPMLAPIATGDARFYLGLAQRQLQDHASARSSFLDAWRLGYRNGYVLYSIIQEDYTLGDKRDGLEYFQLLLKDYPDSPWVHLLLADAHFAKEQSEQARAEYLKALALKPDLLEANFRLGYIAFQEGNRESAAQYFRNEISANPTYVDAHLFLAESLLQLDRKEEALIELRKSLALDPNSDLIYKRLATTLIETSHLQEAATTLKKAEQRFPKDPAFPAQLARTYTLLNQIKDAQNEAAHARQLTAAQHRAQQIEPVR